MTLLADAAFEVPARPGNASGAVGGRLDAVFRASGAARLEVIRTSSPPLELRGPFLDDGGGPARYFLRNVTAGVFGGDRYEVGVRVEAGGRVRIQPTSATRVYDSRGKVASLATHLEVLPGALLEFNAGTTILQGGASLEQDTELVVHPGGELRYSEVLALGRRASGERFAFERFASALRARTAEGGDLYREAFELLPGAARTHLEEAVGGAAVIGTLLLLGGPTKIAPGKLEGDTSVLAGWGTLPGGGVIVRALGATTEAVARLLEGASRLDV